MQCGKGKGRRQSCRPAGNSQMASVTNSMGQAAYLCVGVCICVCVCTDVSTTTKGIYLFTICLRKAAASHENLHLHLKPREMLQRNTPLCVWECASVYVCVCLYTYSVLIEKDSCHISHYANSCAESHFTLHNCLL